MSPHPTTPRRAVLANLAVAAPASLTLAEPPAHPDPHHAWAAERQAMLAHVNGPAGRKRDLDELPEWHRVVELEGLIVDTPAHTLPGLLCQLRLARECVRTLNPVGEEMGYLEHRALTNAVATLERLVGEA